MSVGTVQKQLAKVPGAPPMGVTRALRYGVLASLALYVVSLFLSAFYFEHREPLLGYLVLAYGWWGLFTGDFAWFANPLYLSALVSYPRGKFDRAIVCTVLAIVLGLASLSTREWWFHEGAGTPIVKLGPAFYVWMASFFVLLVVTIVRREWKTSRRGPTLHSPRKRDVKS